MIFPIEKTCEFVTPKHPDKMCDFISDSILDAFLSVDHKSRVAIETLGGHGRIVICGEVTSNGVVNIQDVVRGIVGDNFIIEVYVTEQSPEIAAGVDTGGAGDQGIMAGYATAETKSLLPYEYELARTLCQKIYEHYPYDGKVQVTARDGNVATVVASFQNTHTSELTSLVKQYIEAQEYLINPAGEWQLGGFDADAGLTGRKIIIDNYGPQIPVGGGAFSGKDYTKVDRSAAYMARYIATEYLKKTGAQEANVKIAYAIGKAEPVMATVILDGRVERINGFDLRPRSIAALLDLAQPRYAKTSQWGHFGLSFPWR